MYGFGDDQNPYSESVDLLEDLVVEYLTEMVSYSSLLAAMWYLDIYIVALVFFIV